MHNSVSFQYVSIISVSFQYLFSILIFYRDPIPALSFTFFDIDKNSEYCIKSKSSLAARLPTLSLKAMPSNCSSVYKDEGLPLVGSKSRKSFASCNFIWDSTDI